MNHSIQNTLINISDGMTSLAAEQASKIGWDRGTDSLLRCLYCTRGCHYNRYPTTRAEFWAKVWEILPAFGVNPVPIQAEMQRKIESMPWTTVIAYTPEDINSWIAAQLEAQQKH